MFDLPLPSLLSFQNFLITNQYLTAIPSLLAILNPPFSNNLHVFQLGFDPSLFQFETNFILTSLN